MRIQRGASALLLVAIFPTLAAAQLYPGPFMGGGWGGWGGLQQDPAAEFLRGVGYYNKARAESNVKEAQASSLRAEAFTKWNKALAEAKKAKEIKEAQDRARGEVETAIRNRIALVESGEELNSALDRILEFPTDATHSALAAVPMDADLLRDIPFENASEPITACLDVLTQEDGWPALLRQDDFDQPRAALAKAVDAALEQDLKGAISDQTRADLDAALKGLRSALEDEEKGFPVAGANEADQFLRTLGGMIRLLEDPQGGAVIRQLETYREGSLADLVGFMHAYNLRFGRAASDPQKAAYRELDVLLAKVPVQAPGSADAATRPLVESSRVVGDAAKEIFSNLSWDDLDTAAGK